MKSEGGVLLGWVFISIGAKSASLKKSRLLINCTSNMWVPTLYLTPIPISISISFPWLKAHGNNQSKPPLNSVHCLLVSWFSLFSLYFLILLLLGFLFWVFLSFLSFSVRSFIASCHGKSKFLTVTTKRCRFRVMFNSVFVVYSSNLLNAIVLWSCSYDFMFPWLCSPEGVKLVELQSFYAIYFNNSTKLSWQLWLLTC